MRTHSRLAIDCKRIRPDLIELLRAAPVVGLGMILTVLLLSSAVTYLLYYFGASERDGPSTDTVEGYPLGRRTEI